MAFIIVVAGLLSSALGAVLLLLGGVAAEDDDAAVRRARWRAREGLAALGLGIVLLIVGGVWLPYRNHLNGIGTSGVLLLIGIEILSLALNAVGIVLTVAGGAVLAGPDTLDEAWLARTHRRTRIGIGVLVIGVLAQLGGMAVIAL